MDAGKRGTITFLKLYWLKMQYNQFFKAIDCTTSKQGNTLTLKCPTLLAWVNLRFFKKNPKLV